MKKILVLLIVIIIIYILLGNNENKKNIKEGFENSKTLNKIYIRDKKTKKFISFVIKNYQLGIKWSEEPTSIMVDSVNNIIINNKYIVNNIITNGTNRQKWFSYSNNKSCATHNGVTTCPIYLSKISESNNYYIVSNTLDMSCDYLFLSSEDGNISSTCNIEQAIQFELIDIKQYKEYNEQEKKKQEKISGISNPMVDTRKIKKISIKDAHANLFLNLDKINNEYLTNSFYFGETVIIFYLNEKNQIMYDDKYLAYDFESNKIVLTENISKSIMIFGLEPIQDTNIYYIVCYSNGKCSQYYYLTNTNNKLNVTCYDTNATKFIINII